MTTCALRVCRMAVVAGSCCFGGLAATRAQPPSEPIFVDITSLSGLDFAHCNGMSGELYFVEMMGPGLALVDYDLDGDLDAYLVQGGGLGRDGTGSCPELPAGDRLFRNDRLDDGSPRFVDVTRRSGLRAEGYGMGVTVGDYDDDGWPDLYLTNYGSNQLWRNRGDGTFVDITAETGADDPRWSTSSILADIDGDGRTDLYVANYVAYSVDRNLHCLGAGGARDYCSPLAFQPAADSLLLGDASGILRESSAASKLIANAATGLGVLLADLDRNGRREVYVANDQMRNQLWTDRGGGIVDEALLAGVALNRLGESEAGMGVDAGDYDNDGDEDLVLTHLRGETHTLYRNLGSGLFEDATAEARLGPPTIAMTGFGVGWLDYDNDGWLDLLVTNGEVTRIESQVRSGERLPLLQPDQLFRNLEGDGFEEASELAGAALTRPTVGRGLALGDVDDDGTVDALLAENRGATRLLRNQSGLRNHWLGLRAASPDSLMARTGLRTVVRPPSSFARHRTTRTSGSYLSARDGRVVIGLGSAGDPVDVRLTGLGGVSRELRGVPVDRYLVVPLEEAR